jgi:hypothetical protein
MKRRQVFRAQASKSQSSSSIRRFANSGPVLPFNPASIPGCQLWLDAADTSSILLSGSSNVSLWIDKSNTGTTATPTRGPSGNQITYVTVDTYRGVYINNNGSVGYNSSTYSQLTVQSNFQTTADYSVFAVVNLSNVPAGEYQTIYANARGDSGETRTPNFGAGMSLEFNADSANRMINGAFIGTGRLQTALISSSSALTAYTNTTAYGSVTNGFTRVSTDVGALPMIGGTFGAVGGGSDNRFTTGYFHEILVYNTALSTIQRQKVEGYLAHKWGLQTSLPSNHPHKTIAPTYEEPVFVPTLISGNQLWLDGSDPAGTGTQPANGATVSTWVDKSGNGLNGTSTGTTPLFASGGGITFSAGAYNTSYSSSLTNECLFVVFSYTRTSGTLSLVGQTGDGARLLSLGAGASTAQLQSSVYNVALGALSSSTTVPINTIGLGGLITTNSTMDIFYNGTSVGTPTAVTITSGRTSIIGGASTGGSINTSQYFGGIIHEVIGFTGQLTTSQRRRVEGYLAQKWGLQSSLPANHPFKTIAPTGIPRSITIQSLSAFFSDVNIQSLSIPSNAALNLGTNNHTIEFWFYQTSRGQYDTIFTYGSSPPEWTSRSNYFINIGTTQFSAFIGDGSGGFLAVDGGALITLNTWHHFALVRNGSMFTLYINGASRGTLTSSISIGPQIGSMTFGTWGLNGADRFRGYVSNFRVVNGTAVYTSNFTPPTSPLTAIPNTQVLLQGLVDRSPNAFTVTSTGSVTLSTSVSPFV